MKFCLVSTSTNQFTGYSKVAYNILNQLKGVPNIELFHYGTQYGGKLPFRPQLEGITIKENNDFGLDGLKDFCELHKIDIVMIYNDIGVVLSYLQKWSPPRLWVYLDTVAHGIPQPLLKVLDEKAERIYLFNSYWKSVYNFKNAKVLEHGVDPQVFKKVDTTEIRKQMKIPEDAIVFLNANRNSRRKRLDLTISAFVQFCKRNSQKDAYLLLMTSGDGYYDIASVLYNEIDKHKYDCSKKVLSIQTDKKLFTDDAINQFYNLADIGMNTSTGEGYGLTALEHLAVGKPQVLTYLPSYETFIPKNNAVFVKPTGDREYYERTDYSGAYHETFSAKEIAIAMEEVLNKKVSFVPKTWEEVMSIFSEDLKKEYSILQERPLEQKKEEEHHCIPSATLPLIEHQQVHLPSVEQQ
jgi:glycosyltransferase involved in cell wall biosynthesis